MTDEPTLADAKPVAWRVEDRTHPGWFTYYDPEQTPPIGAEPLYLHPIDDKDATIARLTAERDRLHAAIKRQAGAAKTLREATLAEVQHLRDMDRSEYVAHKTLDSEREANAKLTEEIERLQAAGTYAQGVEAAADTDMIEQAMLDRQGDGARPREVAQYISDCIRALSPTPQAVACPCTMIEQDESCPVGYPSMLCGVCGGIGITTPEKVEALAVEMLRIANDLGEPEDPFAAWKAYHGLTEPQADPVGEAVNRVWLDAIFVVAAIRNKHEPGNTFALLNGLVGDLDKARRAALRALAQKEPGND